MKCERLRTEFESLEVKRVTNFYQTVSIYNYVQTTTTVFKKKPRHRCCPVNFGEIFKNIYFIEHLRRQHFIRMDKSLINIFIDQWLCGINRNTPWFYELWDNKKTYSKSNKKVKNYYQTASTKKLLSNLRNHRYTLFLQTIPSYHFHEHWGRKLTWLLYMLRFLLLSVIMTMTMHRVWESLQCN